MVLEWLPSTLARALARAGGRLSYPAAARVCAAIAQALGALHERGIIHRDLKPSNALLSDDDPSTAIIKLGDLGLSKVTGHGSTNAQGSGVQGDQRVSPAVAISTGGSTVLGTWDYMAPEQWIQSKQVTSKADVYSLGVLLFQMLAGRLPFVADDERTFMALHLLEAPPWHLLDGHLHGANAMPNLTDRLAAMLRKRPRDRPSIEEVVHWFSAPDVDAS